MEVGSWKLEVCFLYPTIFVDVSMFRYFCYLRTRACMPEARAGRPLRSWAPPLPGEPSRPKLQQSLRGMDPLDSHQNRCWVRYCCLIFCARFDLRFGLPFRQFWLLSFPMLVPQLSSNHPLCAKVTVHETIGFPTMFDVFPPGMAPQTTQDRSKKATGSC